MTAPRPRRRRREFSDCQVIDDNIAQALKENEPAQAPAAVQYYNLPVHPIPSAVPLIPPRTINHDARQLLALESIAKSLERLVVLAEKAAR